MDEEIGGAAAPDMGDGMEDPGLDPGGGDTADGAGDSTPFDEEDGQEDLAAADEQPQVDATNPYQKQFQKYETTISRLERRLAQMEENQHRDAQAKFPPRPTTPEAFNKPEDQWTLKDHADVLQWQNQRQLRSMTEEQQWRGRLSAQALGEGNDYDTLVETYLYQNPEIQSDPTSMNFIRNINPVSRYVLAFVHEIAAKAKGDPVKAIRAMRNALTARVEGSRDVQRAVSAKARQTNLGIVRGGRPSTSSPAVKDYWEEDEKAFQNRVRRLS